MLLENIVDADAASVIRLVVKQAKAGREWALRLLAEKLLPRYEPRVVVELPRADTAAAVSQAVADVIVMGAAGELSLPEAREILGLLDRQRRAIETGELAERLDLVEDDLRQRRNR